MTDPSKPADDVQEQGTAADRTKPTSPSIVRENDASENRGMRAPREGSGDVVGSGAGAGGGGGAEDFDSDSAGGGGSVANRSQKHAPTGGADNPVHGSQ